MMFKREEGFTLVELMVVVLIIGILVAIAVPVFLSASANAEAKSCQANQRTIVGALNTYYTSSQTDVASSLLDGTAANEINAALITGKYLKSAPKCKTSKGFYTGEIAAGTPDVTSDGSSDASGFETGGGGHKLP